MIFCQTISSALGGWNGCNTFFLLPQEASVLQIPHMNTPWHRAGRGAPDDASDALHQPHLHQPWRLDKCNPFIHSRFDLQSFKAVQEQGAKSKELAGQKRGCLRLCSGALPGVSASRRDRWSWNAGVTQAPLLACEAGGCTAQVCAKTHTHYGGTCSKPPSATR